MKRGRRAGAPQRSADRKATPNPTPRMGYG